jgi:hypothetical protein
MNKSSIANPLSNLEKLTERRAQTIQQQQQLIGNKRTRPKSNKTKAVKQSIACIEADDDDDDDAIAPNTKPDDFSKLGTKEEDYAIASQLQLEPARQYQLGQLVMLLDTISVKKDLMDRISCRNLLVIYDIQTALTKDTALFGILQDIKGFSSKLDGYIYGINWVNRRVMVLLMSHSCLGFKNSLSLNSRNGVPIEVRVTRTLPLVQWFMQKYLTCIEQTGIVDRLKFPKNVCLPIAMRNNLLLETDVTDLIDDGRLKVQTMHSIGMGIDEYKARHDNRLLAMCPLFYDLRSNAVMFTFAETLYNRPNCKFSIMGPMAIGNDIVRSKKSHLFIYGVSSTGKTTWAKRLLEQYTGLFFCKKQPQYQHTTKYDQFVIIDEYKGGSDVSFSEIFQLCDGMGHMRQIYKATTPFSGTVIVLSMFAPSSFQMDLDCTLAFHNRFMVYNVDYSDETNEMVGLIDKKIAVKTSDLRTIVDRESMGLVYQGTGLENEIKDLVASKKYVITNAIVHN